MSGASNYNQRNNNAENIDPVRGREPPRGIPIPGTDRQSNALRPR